MEIEIAYDLKILRKIRESLIDALKDSTFAVGNNYKLSKTTNSPSFMLSNVRTSDHGTLSQIKAIWTKTFCDKISFTEINGKFIKFNVQNLYSEKAKEFGPETFKSKLMSFIQESLGINYQDIQEIKNIEFTEYPSEKKGGLVSIYCLTIEIFWKVIKILENDNYYSKRFKFDHDTVTVSESKNSDTKDISLVKNFFTKLNNACSQEEELFDVEKPITIMTVELEANGQLEVVLRFKKPDFLDQFIEKEAMGLTHDAIDLTKIMLSLTEEEIKKFVSVGSIVIPEDESQRKSYVNFGEISGVGDINGDRISLTYKETKKPSDIKQISVNDNDSKIIKKTKKERKMKRKSLPSERIKNKKIAKQRRIFAENFLAEINKNFSGFDIQTRLDTKKFTSLAQGFVFSISVRFQQKTEDYLKQKGIKFIKIERNTFKVIYPEKYSGNDEPKDSINNDKSESLIDFCEKERNDVLQILSDKKFFPKKGGPGKKGFEDFSINRSAGIIKAMALKIKVLNNNEAVFASIFQIIKEYYETKSLAIVQPNPKKLSIEIKFKPGFFEKTEGVNEKTEKTKVEETNDADTSLNMVTKSGVLTEEIEKLQAEREKIKKDFLISISNQLANALVRVLKEENAKLYWDRSQDTGCQILHQASPDENKRINLVRNTKNLI